jgi:hypothetical protein
MQQDADTIAPRGPGEKGRVPQVRLRAGDAQRRPVPAQRRIVVLGARLIAACRLQTAKFLFTFFGTATFCNFT